MALEWLGNLINNVNGFLNAPNPQSVEIAESLSEDNPYRGQISKMTGTPTLEYLNSATNWDQNRQISNLNREKWDYGVNQDKRQQEAVEGFNKGMEPLLPQIANTDIGKVLGVAIQHPGVFSPEQAGKFFQSGVEQSNTSSAVKGLFNPFTPEDLTTLSKLPGGKNIIGMIESIKANPNSYDINTAFKTYGTAAEALEKAVYADKQQQQQAQVLQNYRQNVPNLLKLIPDNDPNKQMIKYQLENAQNVNDFMTAWNAGLKSLPQSLSLEDQLKLQKIQADINLKEGQLSRYSVQNDLTQAQIGTEGIKQQKYQSDINNIDDKNKKKIEDAKIKRQQDFIKRVDKDFQDYTKTVKQENRLDKLEWMSQHPIYKRRVREYMNITSGGKSQFQDRSRTTYGLINPRITATPELLAADRYLKASKTNSTKQAIIKAINEHESYEIIEGLIERWNLTPGNKKYNVHHWTKEAEKSGG